MRFKPGFYMSVAWRNLWRHRRRSLITAGAMAVGVGLCMSLVAWSDGMYAMIFEVLVEQRLGHVQVHNPDYPEQRGMYDTLPASTLSEVAATPHTVAASGRLFGFALVGGQERSAGAQLTGIDPVAEAKLTKLEDQIQAGTWLTGNPGEILLGVELAKDIEVGVGDSVVVLTQSADGSQGNALYRVVGTYKTGSNMLDRTGAFMDLADLQELMVLPDQLHEITILTDDPDALGPYVDKVRDRLGEGALVRTWNQVQPQAANMLALQDVGTGIILAVVFTLAAFGVLNTMMMSVFERTHELGVLKAIGLRPRGLVTLIVVESAFLGLLSCLFGLVVGGLLDLFLVTIGIDFSGSLPDGFDFMGITLDPVMRGVVRPAPIIATVTAVFTVSVLASLWPAVRAARLRPVEAIRTE